MGERVTISYRGAAYELGRGKRSYGIWAIGAPRTAPVERWPETPEGWNAAWTRFAGIETPGSIVAAPAGKGIAISASTGVVTALLAIGVLLGVIGLFPGYLGGASLASQPPQLVPHVIYLAAWTLSAVLIVFGGARQRAGALLGLGVSIVTFGLLFTDLGQVIADGAHLADAGLWLTLAGWLACAAGSALALFLKASKPGAATVPVPAAAPGVPGLARGYEVARAALLALAGIGVAITFAPAWDSYLLRTATGQSQTVILGNAFSSPGPMIAGNLMTMIAFGLVVIAAALWRPLRMGAMLLAGAVLPMAAQALSALIQVGEATSPTLFNISPAEAAQAGLTISNGVTADFWIYCILLVVLLVSCAWMLLTPPAAATASPATVPSAPPAWAAEDGTPDWDDEDDEEADEAGEMAASAGEHRAESPGTVSADTVRADGTDGEPE